MKCNSVFVLATLSLAVFCPHSRGQTRLRNSNSQVVEATSLKVGKVIERDIKGGESHWYRFEATKGQYVNIVVNQKGVDVVLILMGPGREKLVEVDGPNGTKGPENLEGIADNSGSFDLEVRPLERQAKIGRYEIVLQEIRESTKQDQALDAGYKVARQADERSRAGASQEAIKLYEKALEFFREADNTRQEIITLRRIGGEFDALADYPKAVEYYAEAVRISRESGDKRAEAWATVSIAHSLEKRGDYEPALAHLNEALQLGKALGDNILLTVIFSSMGMTYHVLGNEQRAREFHAQAAELVAQVRSTREKGESDVAGELLKGAHQIAKQATKESYLQAITKLRAALEILKNAQSPFAKQRRLNTLVAMSDYYHRLGNKQAAIDCLNESSLLTRDMDDDYSRLVMPQELLFIGKAYWRLGETQKALDSLISSLQLSQAQNSSIERGFSAQLMIEIGNIHLTNRDYDKTVGYYNRALAIFSDLKSPIDEAKTNDSLMLAWKSFNKPRIAIFHGKQAINLYQETRGAIRNLDKTTQDSFIKSKSDSYRTLADLLISEGRLPEAQQVLGMLKQEEYFEFIRRDVREAPSLAARAELTPKEAELEKRYREIADQLTGIGRERSELLAKQTRSSEEENRLSKLEADLRVAQEAFHKFLGQLFTEFGKSDLAKERVFQLKESQAMMEDLRELGSGAVALYTLVGKEKYRVILVTPDVQKAFEYGIKDADLNRKVAAFREVLQDPKIDPRPLAQDLYHILVAPFAKDLEQAHAQTLMWSLDGVLRYIPIAALHDRQQYLVERYRNVVFTPASNSRLKDQPSSYWKGLGLGVSKGQPGASALPNVPDELRSIIRDETLDNSAKTGVIPGTVLLDEAFTAEAMTTALRRRYQVVHIASHFSFRPGDETKSALLLGDGSRMTLAEIKNSSNLFGGVELLTLSACDTATGGGDSNGQEVEGFGVLAQRQGAKAVVASLWPVEDKGTTSLMRRFYSVRSNSPAMLKAEALRLAQLGLLNGDESGSGAGSQPRQLVREQKPGATNQRNAFRVDPKAPYAHPYYWAPFILIGNWR